MIHRHLSRLVPALIAFVLLPAPGRAADDPLLLWINEGNRTRRVDVDTIKAPPILEEIFIERASLDPIDGRDMNGQICVIPDGTRNFIAGEDTGQPHPPAGWGVFNPDGEQIGKLTATYFAASPEPNGCAFDAQGRLFTTELGSQGQPGNGQLIVWFPPFDRFPGPAGAYPNTDAPSTNFCKIATDLRIASHVAIDDEGRVYVAETAGFRIRRYSPPFPTSPDAEGGCGSTDAFASPVADSVNVETFIQDVANSPTPYDLVRARSDNWYVSSALNGVISEYDPDGNFLRRLLEPPEGETMPFSTGHPIALTLAEEGDLYYTDVNLVLGPGGIGTGPDGKVFRITFDGAGDPSPPQVVRNGLLFPDGLTLLPGDLELAECQAELSECLAGGPDEDADGEPDVTDTCPGTPHGEDVDSDGCSLDQFCSSTDASADPGGRACEKSDWKNDEPLMTWRDRDCTVDRGGPGREDDRCVSARP